MFSLSSPKDTSLLDLSADLTQCFNVGISKEGLHKKFSSSCVSFLQALIQHQLSTQIKTSQTGLEKHFPFISIKDSTKFSLPSTYEAAYPGYNNFSKKNGLMNIQYEYDLITSNWKVVELANARKNDQLDSKNTADSIESEGLYIRDLGYVTPTYLSTIVNKSAYFLNRLPPQVNIYDNNRTAIEWGDIDRKLKKSNASHMEQEVFIYRREQIKCRLIIERVEEGEYRKRLKKAEQRAKSLKVGISNAHKIRCRYNAFITNVSKEILPVKKIRKTYHLRWQIELVFKTWKSFFKINEVKKVKKERLECQLLSRLLWVLLNWQFFKTSNEYIQKTNNQIGISVLKFFKRCLAFSSSLRMIVLKRMKLTTWLKDVFLSLIETTKCEASWNKSTHYQIIYDLQNP